MPCQVDAQFKCGISTVASVNIFHLGDLAAACLATEMEMEEVRLQSTLKGASLYLYLPPVESSQGYIQELEARIVHHYH